MNKLVENKEQIIYVSLDDSGKLNKNEKCLVYGGLYFTSKNSLDDFKRKYHKIRDEIWNKDYYNNILELKGFTLRNKDRKRLLKFIFHYSMVALIVNNDEILKQEILINKDAKGRYRDFVIKLLIKSLIIKLIKSNEIDPNKDVVLIINMDQESSKSDGRYKLKDGIIEELTKGIINFNYNFRSEPVLFGNLNVKIYSQNSMESIIIQASDLVANFVRRTYLSGESIKDFDVLKFFP